MGIKKKLFYQKNMTQLKNSTELSQFVRDDVARIQIVVCTTEWSRVCRNLVKDIPTMSDIYTNANFATVDIDKCADIKRKHTVASVPTWLIFKDNELQDEIATTNQYLVDRKIKRCLNVEPVC